VNSVLISQISKISLLKKNYYMQVSFLNISTLEDDITIVSQNVRNWLRSDVVCLRRMESPEWLYFEIFTFSLWCCWRFKSHGISVVLTGKYVPLLWRIIVCSSSRSSNPKKFIYTHMFWPGYSSWTAWPWRGRQYDFFEMLITIYQLKLCNTHKTWIWL
jgi:hypothetical protein